MQEKKDQRRNKAKKDPVHRKNTQQMVQQSKNTRAGQRRVGSGQTWCQGTVLINGTTVRRRKENKSWVIEISNRNKKSKCYLFILFYIYLLLLCPNLFRVLNHYSFFSLMTIAICRDQGNPKVRLPHRSFSWASIFWYVMTKPEMCCTKLISGLHVA